jgi:integrase
VGQDVGHKTKNRNLFKRTGRWWYERRIPKDVSKNSLNPKFKDKETIRCSLKTVDVHEARKRRDQLNRELELDQENTHKTLKFKDLPDPLLMRHEILEDENKGENFLEYAEQQLGLNTDHDAPDEHVEWYKVSTGKIELLQPHINAYLELLLKEDKKATAADYRRGYNLLTEFYSDANEINKKNASHLMRKLQERENVTSVTATKWISGYISLWKYIGLDPYCWKEIRLDKTKYSEKREPFSANEVIEIASYFESKRDWLLHPFWIACHTGARLNAVCKLEYNPDDKTIFFPPMKKEISGRTIPAHSKIVESLEEWTIDRKTSRTTGRRFTDVKKQLGFPTTKTFHSTRHTFTTALANLECPSTISAKLVGHTLGNVHADVYTGDLSMDVLRKWIEKVNYLRIK